MFTDVNTYRVVPVFSWSILNGKIGQIQVLEPTESDIAEGNFMRRVYFRTLEGATYFLHEESVLNQGEDSNE